MSDERMATNAIVGSLATGAIAFAQEHASAAGPGRRAASFAPNPCVSRAASRLLPIVEAVAQRSRWSASATGGGCGVADGCVLIGGVTMGGAVSGPVGGDLVTVELGEVVGCHQ
jgi:hypothetical protein